MDGRTDVKPEALTAEVKSLALKEGADLVGIAPVSRYDGAPRILTPQAHLPEAKSVVVMAVHHPDASVEWGGEPNSNYPGPFQIGMIPKLDTICLRVTRLLLAHGHATVPMPCTFYWRHRPYKDVPYAHAASFSHMNAFAAAGLGEYGWHGMVMSPKYGPRQRIISLVTAAELTPDPLYRGDALCDRCGQCEEACYGRNYEPRHLLEPQTTAFTIEGKRFEYAHINRWRCFWGEQCHLDMNMLADVMDLTEDSIYEALDRGVQRIARGAAGYMCSSFKYCMAEPVRRWDRACSPGPRRAKPAPTVSPGDAVDAIVGHARRAGADRISIQPLSRFEGLHTNFYEGFRTDQMYREFDRVITIGRAVPAFANEKAPLPAANRTATMLMTTGRLMIGILDIARYLDDAGFDAMQAWAEIGLHPAAAREVGWAGTDDGTLRTESVICRAPLPEMNLELSGPFDDLTADALTGEVCARLPHVDLLGVADLEASAAPQMQALKEAVPGARSLIALAAELPQRTVELACAQEAECGMSYQFINYQAIRETFWAAQDLAAWLERQGHFAVALNNLAPGSLGGAPPYVGSLPDQRAQAPFAVAAGLGAVGRNGMLLTPQFGPRQRLAFVLTSARLTPTPSRAADVGCPEGCRLCADACPVVALDAGQSAHGDAIFPRQEVRCEWARVLGMVEGEGALTAGWTVPDLPVPDTLSADQRAAALALKDPLQVRCYNNAMHGNVTVERCLQVCPLGGRREDAAVGT
jgi:epoxyqueuosine reductase